MASSIHDLHSEGSLIPTQFLLLSCCKQRKLGERDGLHVLYVKIVPCPDLTSVWVGHETSGNCMW